MLRLAAAFVVFAAPASAEVTRQDCLALIQGGANMVSRSLVDVSLPASAIHSDDAGANEITQQADSLHEAVIAYLRTVTDYCTDRFPSSD